MQEVLIDVLFKTPVKQTNEKRKKGERTNAADRLAIFDQPPPPTHPTQFHLSLVDERTKAKDQPRPLVFVFVFVFWERIS